MEMKERKINKRDMAFLTTYANRYYPMQDSLYDIKEAIDATRGFDKAHNILIKQKNSMENKLKRSRERLTALAQKYGYRVYDIVSEFDGYSN